MKRTFLLCLLLIGGFSSTYSQVDSIDNVIIPQFTDSIVFSVWDVHTKEMSLPGYEKEYEKELKRVVLSEKDQEVLNAKLEDSKSYDQTRALLSHYNLVFDLYHKGVLSTQIRVSTMTGNIDIENKLEEAYFRNNCSAQLDKVLMSLLDTYDFLHHFDELDLEGITTTTRNKQ